MSPLVRSGYNNNNNNTNNNNNHSKNTNKKRKTKSRTQYKSKTHLNNTNNNNNNKTNSKPTPKQKQKQKKQNQKESEFKLNLTKVGYSSDDSIIDDLFSPSKFNLDNDEKDEKNEILDDSIHDGEKMFAIGKGKSKRNIYRKGLLYDRATTGWFDKNDNFFKFKKLFNDMARCTDVNSSELPKIVFRHVDTVNWSYSDVYGALEEFVNEMKKLGNNKWSEIKSDDIIDYMVHIPYHIIPKDLLEQQNQEQKQQQSVWIHAIDSGF